MIKKYFIALVSWSAIYILFIYLTKIYEADVFFRVALMFLIPSLILFILFSFDLFRMDVVVFKKVKFIFLFLLINLASSIILALMDFGAHCGGHC